jgi:hypothetical protein
MCTWSTQPLKMSVRGKDGTHRVTHNLPPSSADVTESGSLNPPEPSGPHRPVIGKLYLYFFIFCLRGYFALVFGVGIY